MIFWISDPVIVKVISILNLTFIVIIQMYHKLPIQPNISILIMNKPKYKVLLKIEFFYVANDSALELCGIVALY